MIYTGADRAELVGMLAEGETRITVTLTTGELSLLIEALAKQWGELFTVGALALYRELIDARMCAR